MVMCCRSGLRYAVLILCTLLIDARFASLRNIDDGPLTLDVVVNPIVPIVPIEYTRITQFGPVLRAPYEGTTECYPVVGCFDNYEPFDNAGLEVPQDPSVIDTNFLLFTRDTPMNAEFLQYNGNDKSITNSRFNSSRWLRIIVHGFTNNRSSIWIRRLTEELLKLKEDEASDVLVVDWGKGAQFPFYNNAAANTRLVGKQISLLLKKMRTLKTLSFDKVHCIGHSLGAHACGYASNGINRQMARISGLDPAGPFFEGKHIDVRLDTKDAKFVDVIHTNTGVGLGSNDPSGHVDFYVNGGQNQPGCPTIGSVISGLLGGQSEANFEQSSCSHSRSHAYFIESINSECPYTAFPCHDSDSFRKGKCLVCPTPGCGQMGFYSIYSLGRGNMYLATKSSSPFCGYHYFVELVLDQDMIKTSGEIFVAIYSSNQMLLNLSMTHKSNADIKAGDTLRHVFSFNADLGKVDYAIVYFNKGKGFLNFGGQKPDDIVISRLYIKSIEDAVVYSAACGTSATVSAYTEYKILLNRFECDNGNSEMKK